MEKTRYNVSCRKCKGSRVIDIQVTPVGEFIDWLEDRNQKTTIISARPRIDGQWGFQCLCGTNDIMTTQEKKTFENPANPSQKEISQILADLIPDKPLFRLERV